MLKPVQALGYLWRGPYLHINNSYDQIKIIYLQQHHIPLLIEQVYIFFREKKGYSLNIKQSSLFILFVYFYGFLVSKKMDLFIFANQLSSTFSRTKKPSVLIQFAEDSRKNVYTNFFQKTNFNSQKLQTKTQF